ncbi:MAG TPA: UDP-N-acetylmuramoyl-L-alanyl-D-glutamate--2,6-diaminopimelate ligase [Candidatus Deferrimicrobiaceae bacterium]|jgi:UDP-N-acetylmuramoyl-L-alanyl-D-glutamate--2,6-diaminopimelate ligase
MRLSVTLMGVASPGASIGALEIRGIRTDSRLVKPGDLFVAITGGQADGHEFLDSAAARGAVAALVERDIAGAPIPVVRVASTVEALPRVAATFHGDPSARMKVVGVTGTNGKTTVTYLLESIFQAEGHKAGVIGTINYRVGDEVLQSGLTTPFPQDLQEVMASALARGADRLVMEVSSHAAAQGRIAGVRFDAALFTNQTHDHLDYHGNMENYFAAKAGLFREYLPAGGKKAGMAFNADDPYGARLIAEFPGSLSFGFSETATVRPLVREAGWDGTRLTLTTPSGPIALRTRLIGAYNSSNVMAAVCGALLLGVPPEAIRRGIEAAPVIPGRMEPIENGRGLHVFVDYAHTPDGLDRILATLQELSPSRLVTLFGCGGNRDKTKRPEMGQIAARRSDVVVVTSDNPRDEDPQAIIRDIVPGLAAEGWTEAAPDVAPEPHQYVVIEDRKAAIGRALALAQPGDTVAIAGKGHENVQIIGNRRLPFDDRQAVRDALANLG